MFAAGASDARRHRLHRETNRHVVADEEPACLEGSVPRQPEILPIDCRLRLERDALVAPWVLCFPQERDVEAHRTGDAVDGQIAGDYEQVRGTALNAGAREREHRVLLDVEKVSRPEVRVT